MAPRLAVPWKGCIAGLIYFPERQLSCGLQRCSARAAFCSAHRVLPPRTRLWGAAPLQGDSEDNFASSDSLLSYLAAFNAHS